MHKLFLYSPHVLQTAIWPIVRPFFYIFLRLRVSGIENLRDCPIKSGVIFAVNHTSELDPIIVPASLPFLSRFMPMFYTSRDRQFYNRSGFKNICYGGQIFKIWGAHGVPRGTHDYSKSLVTHVQILAHSKSVCIFPRGKKLRPGEPIPPVHGGVAYLAWKSNATVIPVRIEGLGETRLRDVFLFRKKVHVHFGTPLFAKNLFNLSDQQPSVDEIHNVAEMIVSRFENTAI